jgi:hypothetical protein
MTTDSEKLFHGNSFELLRDVWTEERPQIVVFLIVQILLGQIGLVAIFFNAIQSGLGLSAAWENYLRSGGHYTFCIAMLASGCSVIAWEFYELAREKTEVLLAEKKMIWGALAVTMITIQATLVGPLLLSQAVPPAKPVTAAKSLEAHPSVAAAPLATGPNKLGTELALPSRSTSESGQPEARAEAASGINHWPQVTLWLTSCFAALILFGLSRVGFIQNRYAKQRKEQVRALSASAEEKARTEFDEKL